MRFFNSIMLGALLQFCVPLYASNVSNSNETNSTICLAASADVGVPCRKTIQVIAPEGFITYIRKNDSPRTDLFKGRFLYPGLEQLPTSFVDKVFGTKPSVPTGKTVIEVTVYWLGEQFRLRKFDQILAVEIATQEKVDAVVPNTSLRLHAVSRRINELGTETLIPADGSKSSLLRCYLPWRSKEGIGPTTLTCNVWTELADEYYMEYSIPRNLLPQWDQINREAANLINTFIKQ